MKAETASFYPISEQITDNPDLLARMHAGINTGFDTLWATAEHSPYSSPEDLVEDYHTGLAREHAFADKVFAAAIEIAGRTDGTVTLLFDVDETIVKKETNRASEMFDVVRPALPYLIDTLSTTLGKRLEIGLLTSRSQSHLDQELQEPTFLAGIVDKVNPNFVISSRDGHIASQFSDYVYDDHSRLRAELGDFLNPALVKEDDIDTLHAVLAVTTSRVHMYGKKLPILKQLVNMNPDRAFVYCDDATSAAVINPSYASNIVGVPLSEDTAFWGID